MQDWTCNLYGFVKRSHWIQELCFWCFSFFLVAGSKGHLRVHPMFLHSNATSHKWAFGGIALKTVYFCLLMFFVGLLFDEGISISSIIFSSDWWSEVIQISAEGKNLPILSLHQSSFFTIVSYKKKGYLFFFCLFAAVAELLDNAVDEVTPQSFSSTFIYF